MQLNTDENSNSSFELDHSSEPARPAVGDQVSIYWPSDNAYHNGKVKSITENGNKYYITYEDGLLKMSF